MPAFVKGKATCGHEPHYAHGMCKLCYRRTLPSRSEIVAIKQEILDELNDRLRAFLRLPQFRQAAIDRERWVPTLEMHDILGHYLRHGRFVDGDSRGWRTPCPGCADGMVA